MIQYLITIDNTKTAMLFYQGFGYYIGKHNPKCNPETWTAYDGECCTGENTCGLGEGDCDGNGECSGNLVCGRDNCGGEFPTGADCCEEKGIFSLSFLVFLSF